MLNEMLNEMLSALTTPAMRPSHVLRVISPLLRPRAYLRRLSTSSSRQPLSVNMESHDVSALFNYTSGRSV